MTIQLKERPRCQTCNKVLAWYDHSISTCRQCLANFRGYCAGIVYHGCKDVLGQPCSNKKVGLRKNIDEMDYDKWEYCKQHGGVLANDDVQSE